MILKTTFPAHFHDLFQKVGISQTLKTSSHKCKRKKEEERENPFEKPKKSNDTILNSLQQI